MTLRPAAADAVYGHQDGVVEKIEATFCNCKVSTESPNTFQSVVLLVLQQQGLEKQSERCICLGTDLVTANAASQPREGCTAGSNER